MTKAEIRKIYSDRRLALTGKEKDKLDDLLLIQFQKLSFEDVEVVLSFWPIEERVEQNTHLFTRYLSYLIPGLRICYPLIDTSTNYMNAVSVDEGAELKENKFGITEPVNGPIVPPQEIDLAIVPLFAFDKQGHRIGYGKGYYDRFLKKCRSDARFVGVSYFEPVERIDDTDDFDVPLNCCITPQNIYEF